jgi:hypothetical protein
MAAYNTPSSEPAWIIYSISIAEIHAESMMCLYERGGAWQVVYPNPSAIIHFKYIDTAPQ